MSEEVLREPIQPESLSALVEMWKVTVEVQQHFNDLEWKIRGLALTVLTGALGAATLALREGSTLLMGSWRFSLASLVLVAGLLVWSAFFFVDGIWYHRLLVGAVKEGIRLEGTIGKALPGGGRLTTSIGDASPWSFPARGPNSDRKPWFTLHSTDKLKAFYAGIGAVLFALALAAHFSAGSVVPDRATTSTTTPTTIDP